MLKDPERIGHTLFDRVTLSVCFTSEKFLVEYHDLYFRPQSVTFRIGESTKKIRGKEGCFPIRNRDIKSSVVILLLETTDSSEFMSCLCVSSIATYTNTQTSLLFKIRNLSLVG